MSDRSETTPTRRPAWPGIALVAALAAGCSGPAADAPAPAPAQAAPPDSAPKKAAVPGSADYSGKGVGTQGEGR